MRLLYPILFLYSFCSFAQKSKKLCDSLVGKPFEVLYNEADAIFEGIVTYDRPYGKDAVYEVKSVYNYKGGDLGFELEQRSSKQWFNFKRDSTYVFLIYEDYQDPVFTPCIFFGKKDRLIDLLEYTFTRCGELPIERLPCPKALNLVCGCDGNTYGNECEAEMAGLETWNYGRCQD